MRSAARIPIKLLSITLMLPLVACDKAVRWQEEVPLNTGETIWVNRTVNYSIQGGAGNPLDMAYRPNWPEIIDFTWNGKVYRYEGDARVMVLAISPLKTPVLVARAADGRWDAKHGFKCVTPFYVQLTPDSTGRHWTWPPSIEPWLYNLPANLMLERKQPEEMATRYTAAQRSDEDRPGAVQSPSKQRIDPAHTGDHCGNRS